MRTALTLAVLALALALVGVGCMGGGDEAASGTETTVTTETNGNETTDGQTTDDGTTEEETTEGETTTGETTTERDYPDSEALSPAACEEFREIAIKLGQALSQSGTKEPDYDKATRLFNRLARRAPDPLREDVETLA